MQAIVETLFDTVYLISVITIGILMIRKSKGNRSRTRRVWYYSEYKKYWKETYRRGRTSTDFPVWYDGNGCGTAKEKWSRRNIEEVRYQ